VKKDDKSGKEQRCDPNWRRKESKIKETEICTLFNGVWEEARLFLDPLKDSGGAKITRRCSRGNNSIIPCWGMEYGCDSS